MKKDKNFIKHLYYTIIEVKILSISSIWRDLYPNYSNRYVHFFKKYIEILPISFWHKQGRT